jgi:hypothetical protein
MSNLCLDLWYAAHTVASKNIFSVPLQTLQMMLGEDCLPSDFANSSKIIVNVLSSVSIQSHTRTQFLLLLLQQRRLVGAPNPLYRLVDRQVQRIAIRRLQHGSLRDHLICLIHKQHNHDQYWLPYLLPLY